MAYADWSIKGPEVATCNCDWGCPCQFNALPTHGNCRAAVAMRIDEGHFEDTRLDGVKFAALFAWPKAIHEGNGAAQPIIDAGANEAQREALLTILKGEETEPGATIFNVIAATFTEVHPPLFEEIDFEIDMSKRIGRFSVNGIVNATTEPIRNPVTGEPHYARVGLPEGFEYTEAEFVSSTARGAGEIPVDWTDSHGHLAMLHLGPTGPVR